MYPIGKINLKFGVRNQESLALEEPRVTIFIGPNNSGKSLILREIVSTLQTTGGGERSLVSSIELVATTPEFSRALIDRFFRDEGLPDDFDDDTIFQVSRPGIGMQATKKTIRQFAENAFASMEGQRLFLGKEVLNLDGAGRLGLISSRGIGAGSFKKPDNTFSRIFSDDALREKLRKVLFSAFGRYLYIDPSSAPGTLRLRFSKVPPASLEQEKSLSPKAVEYHESGELIENASDGVKALTGMLLELYAGDPRILVIDEPEAFLHPSLARLLGQEVAKPSEREHSQKNVFVSTHSASFLMGCVQAANAVNIVRLTYIDGISGVRLLDAPRVKSLFRNPLLRSVNAIEALFYDFVVVVEADSDRAFYDEINHRLNSSDDARGIKNCLFIRAQNKQTVADIIGPLRSLGIPAAGIVDIDVYKEGGSVWGKLISSIGIPQLSRSGTEVVRSKLKEKFDQKSNPKREGGIAVLSETDQEAAKNLFGQLAEYGYLWCKAVSLRAGFRTSGLNLVKQTGLWKFSKSSARMPPIKLMFVRVKVMYGISSVRSANGAETRIERGFSGLRV